MDGKYLGIFKDGSSGEQVINPDHVVRLTSADGMRTNVYLSTGDLLRVTQSLEDTAAKLGWAVHEGAPHDDAPADSFLDRYSTELVPC